MTIHKNAQNWYGIEGIKFIPRGNQDFQIEYKGVIDTTGVIVEETMWSRWNEEENGNDDYLGFEQYMRDSADDVKDLIDLAREGQEYLTFEEVMYDMEYRYEEHFVPDMRDQYGEEAEEILEGYDAYDLLDSYLTGNGDRYGIEKVEQHSDNKYTITYEL